jgi:hypothetical protein
MPFLKKRNHQLQNEFTELAMLKDPPIRVQRLLLVAAIFTQSVPE